VPENLSSKKLRRCFAPASRSIARSKTRA
jgi:hypothetical protein